MITSGHRLRLKGLDDMPGPRRTLRQHYFAFRSQLRTSKISASLWAVLVLALLVSILWGLSRLLGLPLEQWLRTLLSIQG